MRLAPPLVAATLLAAVSLSSAVAAQDDALRFVPREPMMRIAFDDVPALFAALPGMHLGRLFAEPDVARAIGLGRDAYVGKVRRWSDAVDRLLELQPDRATIEMLVERELMSLDWRDLQHAETIGRRNEAVYGVQTTIALAPTPAAAGRLTQRFEQLLAQLRRLATADAAQATLRVAGDRVSDHPGLVLAPHETAQDEAMFGAPAGGWFAQLPGLLAGGNGTHELAGTFARQAPPAPGISIELDIGKYLNLMGGPGEPDPQVQAALKALGLDACSTFRWQLRPDGELVLDELMLDLRGKPGGVLGALLDGVAPPVAQPLPEHALLQVRLAFDVAGLLTAVDELLVLSELPTLTELGLADDLKLAWTGGVALALTRPAPGGLVPRIYASFGIVDADAVARVLARMQELIGEETKQVTYEGKPCVQLRLGDVPPAFQPSWCVQADAVHFAESGLSLRAMLKAQAAGAPPLLDTGDAPRPGGTGAIVPGCEVRFDGAEIHAALHDLWLPLAETASTFGGMMEPLVSRQDLPDHETVAPHLRRGRGVLRRAPDRVTLAMSGTAGGPELHAVLFAYGSLLSGPMTGNWKWQTDSTLGEVAKVQLERIHAAIQAHRTRTGKVPASLGELLAGGDLTDARLLALPGDPATEPVLHEGKEVARTSFEYFADGQKMSPEGTEVVVRLATKQALGWRKLVLTDEGVVIESWEGMVQFAPAQVEVLEEIVEPPPPPPPEQPK
ncbi:MAG: hypothetical protein JNL08_07570 [Planctomycetes bacterium]|nr:hypothetical protein [Planctomycetota bacterium]